MIGRQGPASTMAFWLMSGAVLLFLLLPVAAMLGLGLYYIVGIVLVADFGQVLAALARETDIEPALLATPLAALLVGFFAGLWGLGLSVLWRNWIHSGRFLPVVLTALPLILPRFALGALFLLTGLQIAQWGGDILGFGLVVLAQSAIASPIVAGVLLLGWSKVEIAWCRAAEEANAGQRTIFRRLIWPVLKPYLLLGQGLAVLLSFSDFYSANALAGDTPFLSAILFSGMARNVSPLYFALVAIVLLVDLALVVLLQRALRPLFISRKEN